MSEAQTSTFDLIATTLVVLTVAVPAICALIAVGAWYKRCHGAFRISDHYDLEHRDEPTEPINDHGRVRRHDIVYPAAIRALPMKRLREKTQ